MARVSQLCLSTMRKAFKSSSHLDHRVNYLRVLLRLDNWDQLNKIPNES